MIRLRSAYGAQAHIRQLYIRAQIPYGQHYAALYGAFNSWYRHVTSTQQDTEALARLLSTHRYSLDTLLPHTTHSLLRPYMYKLYVLTNHQPLPIARWDGRLGSVNDYEGLVWFWYAVRCRVVHGEASLESALFEHYVKHAYESLQICLSALVVETPEAHPEISSITPLRNLQNTV